jgi:serine/threonine-protein kinase
MTAPEEAHALRKYRLIAEIGRGGMADVFLAVVQGPAGFNKLVVIKKTRSEMAHDPDFLAMFLDEARLAARLNHPNVVQTHEVGQDGDRYFIAMEYLDGQPLNRIRARATTSFSTNMQVRVLADVLAGLHHAHELCDFDGTALGVVHRDATPQNVFVTYDGLIKVVDFGIAKAIDSSHETRAGMVKGKVTYMAPEQARGERVDRRADVFAVGVMLWEAISGKRMWKGLPELTVVHDLIGNQVPKIRDTVPDAPESLALICDRALAANRDDRYATAQDMHDALNEYLDGAGHTSARDVGKFVAEKFAEDRAKVKTLIESQLKDVRWSGSFPKVTGVDLPKIDPGQIVVTPTGQKAIDSGSNPSSTSGSLTNATASVSPGSQAAKPNRPIALMAVAAVAAIGVLVVGVRFLVPSNEPAPAPEPTQPAAAAAPPKETAPVPPPAPGQDTVKLTIHVSPPDAKIYLDDALLSAGAFEGKVVRTEQARSVRAEAPHYVSKAETVTLTGDVMLSFSLEKEAAGAAAAPPPAYVPRGGARPAQAPEPPRAVAPAQLPPPQPAAAPAPAPTPTGPVKPKRAIDSDSPYANPQ